MKIEDVLSTDALWLELQETEKDALLRRMAGYLAGHAGLADAESVVRAILARESQMSTGIGYGIAIPHCRLDELERTSMIVGRVRQGVPFEAIDEVPVYLLFMLAAPKKPSEKYTQLLAMISRVMAVADTRTKLLHAASKEEFLQVLIAGERQFQPRPVRAF